MATPVLANAEPVGDIVSEVGEGPLWSVAEQALYWLDIFGKRIHRLNFANGKTETFEMRSMPSAIAFRQAGGLLVAWRDGLSMLDLATGAEMPVPHGIDMELERFNDGKVDRRGRFFVGTMDGKGADPVGALYRLDARRQIERVADDLRLSNGIAWSPDDRILYHCDSRPGQVYAYDFDIEAGTTSNRRIFIDFPQPGPRPDGCTVDVEGCLWVAEFGAGRVGRYTPTGERIGEIIVPSSRVTSVAFGGPDLATLFITALRANAPAEELLAQPLAGRLFAARPGVEGLPETAFAG
ncbi:MAG TPA: SMP-30/gluconolactonase/LRE family protein [Devosiaceae bacterium]|jgi:sugar lactone lactonase YvrE